MRLKIGAVLAILCAVITGTITRGQASADETKNLSVTATVAASAGDFETSITKLTSGSPFQPDATIEYEVTYGSNLSTAVDFRLGSPMGCGDNQWVIVYRRCRGLCYKQCFKRLWQCESSHRPRKQKNLMVI
ncbi:MAG: hypothetical protein UZ21_OP11001000943 [Microgenomates bacterium OLB22]|nr:MAG: hypothetical protein UZ21_OP11001000943 [Microgenomates bacterium OLB22]